MRTGFDSKPVKSIIIIIFSICLLLIKIELPKYYWLCRRPSFALETYQRLEKRLRLQNKVWLSTRGYLTFISLRLRCYSEGVHDKTRIDASSIPGSPCFPNAFTWRDTFSSSHVQRGLRDAILDWVIKIYACSTRFQSPTRLMSHRDEWSFFVYMILLPDFEPEWNSRSGYDLTFSGGIM